MSDLGRYVIKAFSQKSFPRACSKIIVKIIFQRVFKLYDKESTGFLGSFELREALASAGYHLNTHILNILGHRYGCKDGKIAFDDFMMCAVRLKSMMGK